MIITIFILLISFIHGNALKLTWQLVENHRRRPGPEVFLKEEEVRGPKLAVGGKPARLARPVGTTDGEPLQRARSESTVSKEMLWATLSDNIVQEESFQHLQPAAPPQSAQSNGAAGGELPSPLCSEEIQEMTIFVKQRVWWSVKKHGFPC